MNKGSPIIIECRISVTSEDLNARDAAVGDEVYKGALDGSSARE
jgi:hypothetical protein